MLKFIFIITFEVVSLFIFPDTRAGEKASVQIVQPSGRVSAEQLGQGKKFFPLILGSSFILIDEKQISFE